MTSVAVYGAGGHAKVAIDVLGAMGLEVVVCVAQRSGPPVLGIPVVAEAEADPFRAQVSGTLVAVGGNRLRSRIAQRLRGQGWDLISAISPAARVANSASVGSGTLVVHGAFVNPDARIGRDVIINTGATVDHDCVIGDGAHIGPGSHLAGSVRVGDHAFIGAGSVIVPGISVGPQAVVGAGSVVVRDVAEDCTVWGSPAHHRERRNHHT